MTDHEQEILRLKAKIMDALLLTVPECKGCDCANYVSHQKALAVLRSALLSDAHGTSNAQGTGAQ